MLDARDNLAELRISRGEYEQALTLFESSLRRRRTSIGADHDDTLAVMDRLIFLYRIFDRKSESLALKAQVQSLRNDKQLKQKLETIATRRARYGADHAKTLAAMHELAQLYRNRQQFNDAHALRRQIVEQNTARNGAKARATLQALAMLASAEGDLGNKAAALELHQQVFQARSSELGSNHPDTTESMDHLALAYDAMGQLAAALEMREQYLQQRSAKQDIGPEMLLSELVKLAANHEKIGQYGKAVELSEQALRLGRALHGDRHPRTLTLMSNLAISHTSLGQHEKALALYQVALAHSRIQPGPNDRDTLRLMNNLASAYIKADQSAQALSLLEEALKLSRVALGEDHPDTLYMRYNLPVLYNEMGLHSQALSFIQETSAILRAKYGGDYIASLQSLQTLANTYENLGQYGQAVAIHEKALKRYRAELGAEHIGTINQMRNLAISYRHMRQTQSAMALVPEIVAGIERLRTLSGMDMERRQSQFAEYSDQYQRYAEWYAEAGNLDLAFNVGDLSKARTLTDTIQAQTALRTLPAEVQVRLQASSARARQLHVKIADYKGPVGALLELQATLDQHNAAFSRELSEIRERYPKYDQLVGLKAAKSTDGARLLAPDELFISYLINGSGHAQAFVLSSNSKPARIDLGLLPNLADSVAAYRELVSATDPRSRQGQLIALDGGGYKWRVSAQVATQGATSRGVNVMGSPVERPMSIAQQNQSTQALQSLNAYFYEKLIKPLIPLAGAYERWIISPDKALALLPFDMLPEQLDRADKPTRILAEGRNISLVQSFAVLSLLKRRQAEYAALHRGRQLLAMGDAVYAEAGAEGSGIGRAKGGSVQEDMTPESSAARAGRHWTVSEEQHAMTKMSWKNLPGTAKEISDVGAVFTGGSAVDTYRGLDASETRLQQLNAAGTLKDYRYLLFSGHGYLAENPSLSSLVLSRTGNPPGTDGYVSTEEWPLYDLRSDLAVLSACDTGVGKILAGEGVMGLPYALFVAGNTNTLLSLWPVNDLSTAEFMQRFFKKLKSGMSQPQALRQTKLEFIKLEPWQAPKFWGAFVLYGL